MFVYSFYLNTSCVCVSWQLLPPAPDADCGAAILHSGASCDLRIKADVYMCASTPKIRLFTFFRSSPRLWALWTWGDNLKRFDSMYSLTARRLQITQDTVQIKFHWTSSFAAFWHLTVPDKKWRTAIVMKKYCYWLTACSQTTPKSCIYAIIALNIFDWKSVCSILLLSRSFHKGARREYTAHREGVVADNPVFYFLYFYHYFIIFYYFFSKFWIIFYFLLSTKEEVESTERGNCSR